MLRALEHTVECLLSDGARRKEETRDAAMTIAMEHKPVNVWIALMESLYHFRWDDLFTDPVSPERAYMLARELARMVDYVALMLPYSKLVIDAIYGPEASVFQYILTNYYNYGFQFSASSPEWMPMKDRLCEWCEHMIPGVGTETVVKHENEAGSDYRLSVELLGDPKKLELLQRDAHRFLRACTRSMSPEQIHAAETPAQQQDCYDHIFGPRGDRYAAWHPWLETFSRKYRVDMDEIFHCQLYLKRKKRAPPIEPFNPTSTIAKLRKLADVNDAPLVMPARGDRRSNTLIRSPPRLIVPFEHLPIPLTATDDDQTYLVQFSGHLQCRCMHFDTTGERTSMGDDEDDWHRDFWQRSVDCFWLKAISRCAPNTVRLVVRGTDPFAGYFTIPPAFVTEAQRDLRALAEALERAM